MKNNSQGWQINHHLCMWLNMSHQVMKNFLFAIIHIWLHNSSPLTAKNGGKKAFIGIKIQWDNTEPYINPAALKYAFIPSQAENRTVQLNGTAAEQHAGGKTDLPLINFRSRERHQQLLCKGGKREGRGKREIKTQINIDSEDVICAHEMPCERQYF